MNYRETNSKTVLFVGGPRDGDIQKVNHNKIACYIKPDYTPKLDNEKTLVIDKEGNEEWVDAEDDVPRNSEPEEFIYQVITIVIRSQKYNVAINLDIFKKSLQEQNIDYFETSLTDDFYIHVLQNKLDTNITVEGIKNTEPCRRKGLYEQISEVNTHTVTDNNYNYAINYFKELWENYRIGSFSGYSSAPSLTQEQLNLKRFDSSLNLELPKLEQE